MPQHKCAFGDEITRITLRPDGANELDPCLYEEIGTYENVTVHVLRCVRCGHIEIEWERQDNTTPYCGAQNAKDGICFNCRDKLFLLRLIRKTGKKLMERREKERHAYIGWCKKLWRDDR